MQPLSPLLRYQGLPLRTSGPGNLHLQFQSGRALERTLAILRQRSWSYARQDDLISIRVPTGDLMAVIDPIVRDLSATDQLGIRAMFAPAGEPPQLSDHLETGSLSRFVARRQRGWLIDMLREDRLTALFQPIVGAKDGVVFGYESLLRGVDAGGVVEPPSIFSVAGGSGLMCQIDQAARWIAIREAARHEIRSKIFINFAPTGTDDPLACLGQTVRLLDEHGIRRDQVVFEIVESERIPDRQSLRWLLGHYRDQQFKVALDDVGAGYSTLTMLQDVRPDYSKLDKALVRNVDTDEYKAVLLSKLLEASRQLGVTTIAEGVETVGEYEWLREHGADYVQGFYVARPGSPPPVPAYRDRHAA
jgi:EAL domain-containing protein (putative c-di-GMP-specific phosphodiesterase class I)